MNTNLLNSVNDLKATEGAGVFDNSGKLEQLFETARDEPKAQIKTLITACDRGFHQELQAAARTEHAACKERLAQKLHDDEGLDLALCQNTLDLIEAAIFGEPAPVCAGCGTELKTTWKVCPECGAPVQAAAPVCAGCGTELKAHWKACPKCGASVQATGAKQPCYEKIHAVLVQYRDKLENLKHCASCGKELQEGWKVCPECGAPVQAAAVQAAVPVCVGCGAELKAHWKACPKCGAPVQAAAVQAAVPVCVGCGAELKAHWKACPKCGAPVQGAAAPAAPVQAAVVQAAPVQAAPVTLPVPVTNADQDIARQEQEINDKIEAAERAGVDEKTLIKLYNQLVELNPLNLVLRAFFYLCRHNFEAAIADSTRAIKLENRICPVYEIRGKAFFFLQDYTSAVRDFCEAIQLNPSDAESYYFRSLCYVGLEEVDWALRDMEKAVSLDPGNADYRKWLRNIKKALQERKQGKSGGSFGEMAAAFAGGFLGGHINDGGNNNNNDFDDDDDDWDD